MSRPKSIRIWLWVLLGILVQRYFPWPFSFIAFTDGNWFNLSVAIVLSGALAISAIVWYARLPISKRPTNFANRWVGAPVLLIGAAISSGFLLASTVVPFGMAMALGSNEPRVVEVSAHFYLPGRQRGTNCKDFVLLANNHGSWRTTRICLDDAKDKAALEEAEPNAFVELEGWGNETAMLYWSARPFPQRD